MVLLVVVMIVVSILTHDFQYEGNLGPLKTIELIHAAEHVLVL